MNKEKLAEKDVKHGMAVRTWDPLAPSGFTEWEVLDRGPQPGQWWLHRRDSEGNWKTACVHRYNFEKVSDGSRTEHRQLASV